MQIFWTDRSFERSAKSLDDQRLRKQIVELGQILSTAIWIKDCGLAEYLYSQKKIYLPTHENHPVVTNVSVYYNTGTRYLMFLLDEYYERFDNNHNMFSLWATLFTYRELFHNSNGNFINHTSNHQHIQDVTEAYRQCLIEKWHTGNPKWTNRQRPEWAL